MHSLFSYFSVACHLLFHWLRFPVSLSSSVVHHLFPVIVSLSISLRCSVLYRLFFLFSRFFFVSSLRVCLHQENLKKLFKTKRVVGHVIFPLKTQVAHRLSRQNLRAAHTFFPAEKYILLLCRQIWGGNVRYFRVYFALSFLPSFCVLFLKSFSRPTDYVELLSVFLNIFTLCANVLLPKNPFQMEAGLLVTIISFLYSVRDIFIIMVDTGAFKSTSESRPI